jgi:hypothetical protein
MSDMLTVEEHFGSLEGKTMVYIGDGNNVARSLSVACGKFGMRYILACPPAYELPADDMDRIMSQVPGMDFETTHDPSEAVREADIVYTDTWVSMGQEEEKAQRVREFAGFQIDEKLMSKAPKHSIVLHCLPAYRGLEISEGHHGKLTLAGVSAGAQSTSLSEGAAGGFDGRDVTRRFAKQERVVMKLSRRQFVGSVAGMAAAAALSQTMAQTAPSTPPTTVPRQPRPAPGLVATGQVRDVHSTGASTASPPACGRDRRSAASANGS